MEEAQAGDHIRGVRPRIRAQLVWACIGLALFPLAYPPDHVGAQQDLHLEAEGHSYHVRLSRGVADGPTIVLESGIAAKIGHWAPILPELAKIARVFAYERPGIGGSSEDPDYDPAPETVARSLRALLRVADMPPPYLLIGHSLGGIYAKAFVDIFPEETAGVVFVDPTDFNESWPDWQRLFSEIGPGEEGRLAFESELDRLYDQESPAVQREWKMIDQLRRRSFEPLRSLGSMMEMPVRVVLGTRVDPKPDVMELPSWFSFEAFQETFFAHRHQNFWRWIEVLPSCRVVTSTRSGHFVHQDEPELVLREIRELYHGWRARPSEEG